MKKVKIDKKSPVYALGFSHGYGDKDGFYNPFRVGTKEWHEYRAGYEHGVENWLDELLPDGVTC